MLRQILVWRERRRGPSAAFRSCRGKERCQRTCLAFLVVVIGGEHWLQRCWLLAIWLELLLGVLKAGHGGRISAQAAMRRKKRRVGECG